MVCDVCRQAFEGCRGVLCALRHDGEAPNTRGLAERDERGGGKA
jgi:hypothetical protein